MTADSTLPPTPSRNARLGTRAIAEPPAGTVVDQLLAGGPNALRGCKELVRRVAFADRSRIDQYAAALIASARAGEEGREGVAAFLERREARFAGR